MSFGSTIMTTLSRKFKENVSGCKNFTMPHSKLDSVQQFSMTRWPFAFFLSPVGPLLVFSPSLSNNRPSDPSLLPPSARKISLKIASSSKKERWPTSPLGLRPCWPKTKDKHKRVSIVLMGAHLSFIGSWPLPNCDGNKLHSSKDSLNPRSEKGR